MNTDISQPLVTVITVTYNAVGEIEKTIQSVLAQTYPAIEYIIIDGGSTDGTLEVIDRYRDQLAAVVSEKDNGVYDAMNKGIDLATGAWINFMNTGDTFASPRAIADVFAAANVADNPAIVYGDTILRYPFGLLYHDCHPEGNDRPMTHQSVFARADVLRKEKFDCRYKICADADFYEKAKRAGRFEYVPVPVSIYESWAGLSSARPVEVLREDTVIYHLPRNARWYVRLVYLHMKTFFMHHTPRLCLRVERRRLLRNKRISVWRKSCCFC